MNSIFKRLLSVLLTLVTLSCTLVFTFPARAKSETGLSMKRQTVIEEMKKMAIIKWKPSKTYKTYHYYAYAGGGGSYKVWTKGRTYYGVPYSQNPTIVNPYNHKINVTYDVCKSSLSKKGTLSRDLGRNDCSSSVVMALQTVDDKIQLTFTSRMRPGVNNLVAVGKYTYYGDKYTTCQKNGSAVMYSCYSKLKPGDLLIRDGHAMMVVGVDNSAKTVTVVHQTGLDKHYNPETDTSRKAKNYADTNSTWGVNDKMSFHYVWSNGYVPLASKALIEDDKKPHSVTMCSKVKKVRASAQSPSSITLTWNKDKKADGYIVYQFKDGQFVKIGSTETNSFTVESLYSAKDYRFAVKSYLKENGKTHVYIDFSIITASTSPKKVTGVSAKIKRTKTVVTWNETNRAENYFVYFSPKKNGKYKYTGSSKTTSFTADNTDNGYYKVKAVIYRKGDKIKGELSNSAKAD